MSIITRFKSTAQERYHNLSTSHQTLLQAIQLAVANFFRDAIAGTAAAGMAYYFLFSIFPLTLLITVLMGHYMGVIYVQDELDLALNMFLPAEAVKFIVTTINGIVSQQEPFGIMGLLGLTWAGLGLLGEVTRVLDVIFNVPRPRTLFQQRVIASMMVLVLIIMFFGVFLTLGLLRLMAAFMFNHTWVWLVVALRMTPVSMNVLIFALVFRRIPNCEVSWDAIWPAAILGGFGWELARIILNWYLGLSTRYSVIYGSISVAIVLMLWAYFMSMVFLLSAELCARLNDWILHHNQSITLTYVAPLQEDIKAELKQEVAAELVSQRTRR
jgi:membrane protein